MIPVVCLLLALAGSPQDTFGPGRLQLPIDPNAPKRMYGPALPDPMATECAANDPDCIASHDDRALDLALQTHDSSWCAQAVYSGQCEVAYELIVTNVATRQR